MPEKHVVVVGAGAAGILAAGQAAAQGANVLLLEKMGDIGSKILISGQSRCNLTNSAPLEDFIPMYGPNGRFLYGAFKQFFRQELVDLLAAQGLDTVTERGGRIFPASGRAADVVSALRRQLAQHGVTIRTGETVTGIDTRDGAVSGVVTRRSTYPSEAVIMAAGGTSYPVTGSSGDGYRMAAELGHTLVKLRPALVPLVVHEIELAKSMQGVSLKNVRLTAWRGAADRIDLSASPIYDCGRGITGRQPKAPLIESRQGEMMMTHFGIGGPITLQMSLAVVDSLSEGLVSVSIDLKPALTPAKLRERLQRDFDSGGKKTFRNILHALLPQKMIEPMIELSGIPSEKNGFQIDSGEKERLVTLLKGLRFNVRRALPIEAAIVTAGGVALNEIDPRTMQSRLVRGLYFCGEVLDIDGDTGGFNLQAAFSTGFLAGDSAASTGDSPGKIGA
jgi:hypothetical protein